MNKREAAKILSVLAAAYPRVEVSQETIAIYTQFLQDLDYGRVQAAVIKHIATSTFFPSIAELRQAALDMSTDDRLPLPGEAWEEVVKQMKIIGYTGKPQFSHELIEKTVQAMGGWINLCQSTEGMVDRAHFIKIYESYRSRHMEETKVAPVVRQLVGSITKSLPGEVPKHCMPLNQE